MHTAAPAQKPIAAGEKAACKMEEAADEMVVIATGELYCQLVSVW